MYPYSYDKETRRFMRKLGYFFRVLAPLLVFLIFYAVVVLDGIRLFSLSLQENQKLLSYNNEVLVYEWTHQKGEEDLFYNERHKSLPSFVLTNSEGEFADAMLRREFDTNNAQRRNIDRERDLEILRIGLKLYREKRYGYPIAASADKIEWGTATQKALKEVLYNVPTDPVLLNEKAYRYQSSDGYSYTLTMTFEIFDEDGKLTHQTKSFKSN